MLSTRSVSSTSSWFARLSLLEMFVAVLQLDVSDLAIKQLEERIKTVFVPCQLELRPAQFV